MSAGSLNFTGDFEIEAGSTFDHTFPFVDTNGAALDLSAYTEARISFRPSVDSTTEALAFTHEPTATLDGGTSGIEVEPGSVAGDVRIVISAIDSTDMSYDTVGDTALTDNREGVVHCELVDPAGVGVDIDVVLRIFAGQYSVSAEGAR